MVPVKDYERWRFLVRYTLGYVLYKEEIYRLGGSHCDVGTMPEKYLSKEIKCRIHSIDSNESKSVSISEIFPFIREIESITDEERLILKDLETSKPILSNGDEIDLMDMNFYQYEYLKSINIDVPLFFENDHENNFETALDLGIALPVSDYNTKYCTQIIREMDFKDRMKKFQAFHIRLRLSGRKAEAHEFKQFFVKMK